MKEFKKLKFQSVIPQDILQAVGLLEKIGYEAEYDFSADDAAKHSGVCAWDDGEITEGWLDAYSGFKQITLEELKEMVGEGKSVLWLNKETLEERYLDKFSVFPYHSSWVEVPEGVTFATGEEDNFVFRKDGWYYEDGVWVATELTFDKVGNYSQLKLFWVKSHVKDNVFTLERLLGCEVLFEGGKLFIEDVVNSYSVEVGNRNYQDYARVSDLTFFTEDGDELTFDEYVQLYYPKR